MTTTETYADHDGDFAEVTFYDDGEVILQTDRAEAAPADPIATVLLDRDQVLDLYHRLGDHLVATGPELVARPPIELPDATADGYDWPAAPTCCTGEDDSACCPTELPTVLDEAQAAIYGDRQGDYGHPRDNWTRTAILWTGLLQHKLADGEYITPEDGLRCMVAVKLARDVNQPKRDNRVDGAGYFACLDRLETGQ